MMIGKIAIILLALSFLIICWLYKNLDKSVDNLRDAYIHLSRAYEKQEQRMEKLQAAVRDILKDINSR